MTKGDKWAADICAAWQRSVSGIFKAGELLVAAKKKLEHGAFQAMVKHDLPFGARTAQCLMKIASDKRLSKANHGARLPASWRTLYEMTRLDDEKLERVVARGPEVRRHEIETLIQVTPAPMIGNSQTISVHTTEHPLRIATPYYVPAGSKPSRSWPARVVSFPAPAAEPEQPRDDELRSQAMALIDALARPEVRKKVLELVHGERQADREGFEQAVRQLAAALDRGGGVRGDAKAS
jgi:hypothetical protein